MKRGVFQASNQPGGVMKSPMLKIISLVLALDILLAAGGNRLQASLAQSNLQRDANPSASKNDVAKLVNGNNAFALDLYQALRTTDGNLIHSPYSISLALAMTFGGARSETESQMASAMHFDLPQAQLHPAFNALDLSLAQNGKAKSQNQPLQLNIANAVWAEQTYPFLQNYLDLIALNYGAAIHLADFVSQYEPVHKEINGWVSDQTNKKINDLLAQGTLNTDTRMVLVNAIYFKADWEEQFDPNSTSDAPFHLLDGSESQVRMMHGQRFSLPYFKGDGFQAIELTYKGGTAAMDVIVPDAGNFILFESALDAQKFNDILGGLHPATVILGLPKFTFTHNFSLSSTLKSMGMPDAFDPNKADFSGMTGNHDLYISDVIHKAFVAVDEKGTEAAAATAVIMQTTSALMPDVDLTIDRPFIFFIRDTVSGQILFSGRVVNPAQ